MFQCYFEPLRPVQKLGINFRQASRISWSFEFTGNVKSLSLLFPALVDVVPMMLNKSVSLFLVLWVSVWVIVPGWAGASPLLSPHSQHWTLGSPAQPSPAQQWAVTHTHTIAEGQTFPHPKILQHTIYETILSSMIVKHFMVLLYCKYILKL